MLLFAGSAAACKLVLPEQAQGIWVLDDGSRMIGYRIAADGMDRFALRFETSDVLPTHPLIACPTCTDIATLALPLVNVAGASDPGMSPGEYTFDRLRRELEQLKDAIGARLPATEAAVALGTLKGWAAPVETWPVDQPARRKTTVYGYVSDGCMAILLEATPRGENPPPLPGDEAMGQFGEILKAVTISRFDPQSDPAIAKALDALPR